MKKTYIYAAVLSALLIFGALTAVYQINHPGRITPSGKYTKLKAGYLTADYSVAAEQLGLDKDKKARTPYAALIETSTPELEEGEKITAVFYFFDVEGKNVLAYSNGTEAQATDIELDDVWKLYDSEFKFAENTDYGIPDYGTVKVYLRVGDGVYFKNYSENELPDVIKQYLHSVK